MAAGDEFLAKAGEVRSLAYDKIRQVAQDPALSQQGRVDRKTEIEADANRQLADLHAKYREALATYRERARARVLAHPGASDALSLRDAAMRADQLESQDEALRLFSIADRQNDDALEKEILAKALDMHWPRVFVEFERKHPNLKEPLGVLWDSKWPERDRAYDFKVRAIFSPL